MLAPLRWGFFFTGWYVSDDTPAKGFASGLRAFGAALLTPKDRKAERHEGKKQRREISAEAHLAPDRC
jgi:hypothetical protein